ncbi:MAG: GntR family transcriptional regulator [Candidatus Accumulibacter sp.]|jgi:DNA-binding GntR family transcriptional regulator|nr:GntR family transcriptional regulator [Accumulibacter sp.]
MKSDAKRRHSRKPTTLVDRVYQEIQNKILNNVLGAGYQALEQELAEEMGISRTPVREALIRLQRDGLVEVVPRHGMRVLPISLTDIQEIHEILTSLEGLAVGLAAARRLSPKELDLLDRSTKKMDEAHEKSDLKAWAQADEDFHCNLIELSGNRILVEVADNFWNRAKRARLTMLSLRQSSTVESIQEHVRLIEAIRNGESAKAREILEYHRKRGITNLKKLMEERRDSILPL